MSPDNFNKDFARAFTQDCILYSPIEEYRYGNLALLQFAGDAREMKSIAISVVKNMYQGKLITRIIRLLENKSIPQVELLCSTANNLISEFKSYTQQEPYTSPYCNDLIHTLESFYELANSLNNDICGHISSKLNDINTSICNSNSHVDIDGFYFYQVIEQIEFYLKNLMTYYYHFLIVKEQENENCKGIGLTTQVADYLWELIGIIETVCDNIEDVLNMLLTWEVSMDMCDVQALYN